MNNGSPTRYDIFHNSTSAIDLTICSSVLRLDCNWSVRNDLYDSDHWPITIEYVQVYNLLSPCLPKWKINEAHWSDYATLTAINMTSSDCSSHVAAYDYLTNVITEKAESAMSRTVGLPKHPVVPC